jgi:hypothetical protein
VPGFPAARPAWTARLRLAGLPGLLGHCSSAALPVEVSQVTSHDQLMKMQAALPLKDHRRLVTLHPIDE